MLKVANVRCGKDSLVDEMASSPEPNEKCSPRLSREHSIAFYECCREYIGQQANWVNARLTWMLTLQGFLFAAYAFGLSSLISGTSNNRPANPRLIHWVLFFVGWILPTLGTLVSILGGLGVLAARLAIEGVHKSWPKAAVDEHVATWPFKGGGSNVAHLMGYAPPWGIPIVLILVWLVLLIWVSLHWNLLLGIC